MATRVVYVVGSSFERHRPFVDWTLPANAGQDWNIINFVLDNRIEVEDCVPLEVHIDRDDALDWDFYGVAGTYGVFSQRAYDVLSPYVSPHFRFLLLPLNGVPYYFIKREQPLDCLNVSESELVMFPHDPTRVMLIEKYAFCKDLIDDPLLLHIPQNRSGIFCTDSILEFWKQAGLRGLRFEDAEPPGGYKHPALRR